MRSLWIAVAVLGLPLVGQAKPKKPARAEVKPPPACPVDLLDAGDGSAIKRFAPKIRKAGFRIAHTGSAKDPHERVEVFFARECEGRAHDLGQALGVADKDVQLASWKMAYPITFVPPGQGKVALKSLCDLEPDADCLDSGPYQEEQNCFADWGGCSEALGKCEYDARLACATRCDPACARSCTSCASACKVGAEGEACRKDCASARASCRTSCMGSGCRSDYEACRAGPAKQDYEETCKRECVPVEACRRECQASEGQDCDDACPEPMGPGYSCTCP